VYCTRAGRGRNIEAADREGTGMASDEAYHRPQRSEDGNLEAAPISIVAPILGRIELPTEDRKPRILEKKPTDASFAIGAGRLWDEDIINVDDRIPVPDVFQYPWRAICALRITSRTGNQYVGTGWLAAPSLVVTAGHCLYLHKEGGWAKEITVIPAMNGNEPPRFDAVRATRFRTVDGWIEGMAAGSDYGGILLDRPLGDQLGYFSVGALGDDQLKHSWANISGYPSDRGSARIQFFHARLLVAVNESRLFYDIDTFGGQSGSPIWFTAEDGRRIAVGIHTSGGKRENAGTRITGNVLANLRDWRGNSSGGAMATAS
jgi:V8-like Glu-specific endopeptidase